MELAVGHSWEKPLSFVLYNAPQSTCSQKVRISLWEKGLEFSERKLDLFKGDQLREEYRKLNPNGVVADYEMGAHATSTLLDIIGGESNGPGVLRMRPKLVIRNSTAVAQ